MKSEHGNGSARNHEALSGEVVRPKSMRALAKELGVTHTELWRWKLMAEIPEAEFERLLDEMQERGQPLTTRALADYARRRRGDWIPDDIEHCPHCGEPIRRRG